MASAVNAQVNDRPIVVPRRAGRDARKVFDRGGWLSETGYFEDERCGRVTQQQIQPPRGMNDMLPADIAAWQRLEGVARELFAAYAYQEIRVPDRRAHGAVQALDRRVHRHRAEGDVHVRGSGRRFADAAPRSDGRHRARDDHATACCTTSSSACGARARCSATRSRSAVASVSFISSTSRRSAMPGPDIDAELIMLSARLLTHAGRATRSS